MTDYAALTGPVPRITLASFLCSISIIEYTIPQIVRLSKSSAKPLQAIPLSGRFALLSRNIVPQTIITAVQFGLVRELRDALDHTLGYSRYNVSLAYGVASVPLIAAKYNLIQESTYHHDRTTVNGNSTSSRTSKSNTFTMNGALKFWARKIQPGLMWSYLRDTGSIGGGIVLGPVVTTKMLDVSNVDKEHAKPYHRFLGGLFAGCFTGLGTQLFHNTALTAGRIAEVEGRTPGTLECLRACLREHGVQALYVNIRFRVAIIATWTAILNVTEPFDKKEKNRERRLPVS